MFSARRRFGKMFALFGVVPKWAGKVVKMKKHITMKEALERWAASRCPKTQVTVKSVPYGWTVEPDHHEWVLDVRCSSGQGGSTVWSVVRTEIDMGMEIQQGESETRFANIDILRAVDMVKSMSMMHYQVKVDYLDGVEV